MLFTFTFMDIQSVIFLGATGAVGSEALRELLTIPSAQKITLLGRREVAGMPAGRVQQHRIDIFEPSSYADLASGHEAAICTLGVGQPSKMSREEFLKIDKQAVIDFARACRQAGVAHFELLSSVGVDASSSSFFLRSKGELVEELKALRFPRLSIFRPSMILTPTNRYGLMQGITLKVWPLLKPLLIGGLKKYRGVKVADLGGSMARNLFTSGTGYEELEWEDFQA